MQKPSYGLEEKKQRHVRKDSNKNHIVTFPSSLEEKNFPNAKVYFTQAPLQSYRKP